MGESTMADSRLNPSLKIRLERERYVSTTYASKCYSHEFKTPQLSCVVTVVFTYLPFPFWELGLAAVLVHDHLSLSIFLRGSELMIGFHAPVPHWSFQALTRGSMCVVRRWKRVILDEDTPAKTLSVIDPSIPQDFSEVRPTLNCCNVTPKYHLQRRVGLHVCVFLYAHVFVCAYARSHAC
jgi:hypothetical protein